MTSTGLPLVLASTSPFRQALLARLGLEFAVVSPLVDETPAPNEAPEHLVGRLSEAKARAGAAEVGDALVIGSDQVALVEGDILGKPGSRTNAVKQLARLSGRAVTFLTGLCLFNSQAQRLQSDIVLFRVIFRELDAAQIDRYVAREQPFNCAGSFKSEGLGIALFKRMEGHDPTALIGLPLIRLTTMLREEGIVLP